MFLNNKFQRLKYLIIFSAKYQQDSENLDKTKKTVLMSLMHCIKNRGDSVMEINACDLGLGTLLATVSSTNAS